MNTAASTTRVPVSVVIPAHNEERVIARCLDTLTTGAEPAELEIVVVCNGCDDDTAAVARASAPDATIVDLPRASKADALNAGDALATRFPRFYVDADIELRIGALRSTAAQLLQDGVLCAAPMPEFDLSGRPWTVRHFYEVWQQLPYLNERVVGNGVYALSEHGRSRFGSFPPLTADDQFVLQQFDVGERCALDHCCFVVHPPRDVSSLVRVRARARRGARELDASGLAPYPPRGGATRALVRMLRRPAAVPSVAAYIAVVGSARLFALPRHPRWERDDTARLTG